MEYSAVKPSEQFKLNLRRRQIESVTYNTKVALWQLPYDARYKQYDDDDSRWVESHNLNGSDEIKEVEEKLNMSLSRYKIAVTTISYDDHTYDVENIFANGSTMTEHYRKNYISIKVKDKSQDVVAEKIIDFKSADGRKTIYKHYHSGDDTFTVVQSYSYDTTKNKATDIVNFGYTSDESKFTEGNKLENEYYLLNGKQVDIQKNDSGGYSVKNEKGVILTFQVE